MEHARVLDPFALPVCPSNSFPPFETSHQVHGLRGHQSARALSSPEELRMRDTEVLTPATATKVSDESRTEAQIIQVSLLPKCTLRGPGFEVAFRFSPLDDVGGDFADFFLLPNGHVGIYVGDVVGKGLIAAMYGALVMGTMRGTNKTGEDPAAVLGLLNKRLMVRPVPDRYCCTLYADYDPQTRQLNFSNAGEPYPLLASKAGCCSIGEGGIPSGLFPEVAYDTYRMKLEPGDAVLFSTDGLHELQDSKGQDLSWNMLGQFWKNARGKSADEALDHLFTSIEPYAADGRRQDDITAVALKITG
jgi:phosphoserine phosphatase RsbU/P